MTTTREAAMEAALHDAKLQLQYLDERSPSGTTPATISKIDAALSTPATEPQGYVEGLEAAAKNLVWAAQTSGGVAGRDEGLVAACDRVETALAARPAPQPAADTRVAEDALREAIGRAWCHEENVAKEMDADLAEAVLWEIRAIIGTATPAPSDKIAEAARECRPETYASGVQCRTCGQSWGEDGPEQCPNAALAGKGE